MTRLGAVVARLSRQEGQKTNASEDKASSGSKNAVQPAGEDAFDTRAAWVRHSLFLALAEIALRSSIGRDPLRVFDLVNVNPDFGLIAVTRNTAASDYHNLWLQCQHRFSFGARHDMASE